MLSRKLQIFWPIGFWEVFLVVFLCKSSTVHYGPILLQGSWFDEILIYTTWVCFHTSYTFSGRLVVWKNFFSLYFFVKHLNPHTCPTLPRYSDLNKIEFTLCFHTSNSFSWQLFFYKKKIEKYRQFFHDIFIIFCWKELHCPSFSHTLIVLTT